MKSLENLYLKDPSLHNGRRKLHIHSNYYSGVRPKDMRVFRRLPAIRL